MTPRGIDDGLVVARHRTAMVRHHLSQPMSLLVRTGVVRPGVSVFDYGCGQGDDLRGLIAAGVEASGWDPHFAPDAVIAPAEIVNLGFVLNVIEDERERSTALERAWTLAGRALVVSVMIAGAVPVDGLKPFRDGYLTSRGTFQKYYQQDELRKIVAHATGSEPVALAPGIFVAFRRPEDEQEFLLERRRGRRASTAAYASARPRASQSTAPVHERIQGPLEAIAAFALDRGRMPHADELPSEVHDRLAQERVGLSRAVATATDVIDEDAFHSAAASRREDLLVHQALNVLNRTRSASRPGASIVRDIRHHFGSQQQFAEQALEYLHALADPSRTAEAMVRSAGKGLGALDEDGRLVIDGDRVEQLEGVLRCYYGCAAFFVGELGQEYIARLDPVRRQVSLFRVEDRRSPFPIMTGSVTIDLKRQNVIMRDDRRVLARKADVYGLSARSRQRDEERKRRAAEGWADERVLIRL
ncbi:DNA phosphorothioation-associated putative methyltransferase [Sphingomonas mollis]|uniref:DNA phosphorothioation-associated putative methyltransferase n=1 Tax=Sphingomonas mollis TaxID=2795726 RepID=A0ABS0XRX5_9SPHN|nr:DNA phosphorothioation-associated putative methyltransferase [Sphingomonas sp. BT553]MBJ6122508.1 DNA phosphorothioation-associated putative methyltransferase [Sphingomonas sp. BT553]